MKKTAAQKLSGICGIYCGTCPSYLAVRENDREQMEKISRETGIPVDEVRCDGCLSDHPIAHCQECRHGFRRCAREKHVTWCFECADFPCERLEKFRDVHIVNGISHHAHVIDELNYMKKHGIDAWAEIKEKTGRCPQCGKRLYWFSLTCPQCHAEIKR